MGFNNPRCRGPSWSGPCRAGRSAVPTGAQRRRQPGLVAQAAAYEPARAPRAAARGGALRRAALPLELQLPRRRLATPRSWPRRRPGSGLEALALTDHDGFYGVVRFAEAARAVGPAHGVRRRAHRSGCTRAAERRAPIPRAATCWCWPATPWATPGWPGPSAAAQLAGEKGSAAATLDELTELAGASGRGATGSCSPAAARARCRPRSRPTGPAAAARAARRAGRRGSGATTSRSSCGTTATRSTRPATTPWPTLAVRAGVDLVATNNVHYATPSRRPLATALAAVRARRSLDEIDGWLPGRRPAPTCARGPSRPAASPATPAWSSGPPSSASSAPSTCSWSPRTCRRSRAPTASTRWATSGAWSPRRAAGPALRPAPSASGCPAPTRRSTTSSTSSSSSASPATSSSCGTSSSSASGSDIFCQGRGLGRQLRGLLRARHHQRRRGRPRPAVRALPVARARRPARHRPRHRERPARGGHPVRLRAARPRPRRAGRQRHHLPGQVGGPRHGQGARLRARPAGRVVEAGRRWGPVAATAGSRTTSTSPPPVLELAAQVEHFPRHLGIHSGGMVHLRPAGRRGVPGRVGPHGGPHRPAVGQGRLRGGRPREVRPARPRDALGAALRGRPRRASTTAYELDLATIPQDDRGLRHALPGRLGRRVPGRVPGPDGHAAPARAPHLLRPRRRGRAHPPRPDPGRLGAPLHPPPQRARSRSPTCTRCSSRAWRRPSACRCSRSSSCRWPSTSPGSRPARPTSSARPWARSAAGSGWSGCRPAALRRAWPSGASPARSPSEIWEKLAAFANYGFPESHSVSFAYLVYASSWLKRYVPGGVLRGAAQRPADGLLLAALAGAGRPPPRRRGPHAPTSTRRPTGATLETDDRHRQRPATAGAAAGAVGDGRAGGAARHRLGAGHRRRPGRGDRRRPAVRRHGGPRSRRAGVTAAAARGAGHRRRLRLLRARAARGAVGAPGRWPSPGPTGWPASSPASTPRRCRAWPPPRRRVADLWATGVSPRRPPHPLRPRRTSTGSAWCTAAGLAAVAPEEQGARRRGRHPPPAAGHRRGHHCSSTSRTRPA